MLVAAHADFRVVVWPNGGIRELRGSGGSRGTQGSGARVTRRGADRQGIHSPLPCADGGIAAPGPVGRAPAARGAGVRARAGPGARGSHGRPLGGVARGVSGLTEVCSRRRENP